MFWNPRDLRADRRTLAYWLAIVGLVVAARPVAASEIMAAVPTKSAPPAPICRSGQCAAGKQHQRHADRCEGRCANGNCGKPGCPAHCPVRPDRFGFYGTQWRVWPGQGVVQASFTDAASPVRPPKSEIPSADEESPPSAPELPADEESRDEELREEEPAAEPLPPAKAPAAPAAKDPAIEKPVAPAAEENLFDEASHRRRRHEVLASLQQSAMRSELARQEALRQQAGQVQAGAMTGLPQAGDRATPSAVRTVAHEEPVPPSEPPRVNPLR